MVQSLADFSNPLVLGGNFDVLATQIYFYITGSQLDYQAASTLGAFLLLFSLLVFCVQYMWIGKRSYVTVSGKSYRGDVQPLPVTWCGAWSPYLRYGLPLTPCSTAAFSTAASR